MANSKVTFPPPSIGPIIFALLLAVGSIGTLGNARAETGEETADSVGFRLLYFGEEAGAESFRITKDPARRALLVTARGTANLAGRSVEMRQELRVDPDSYTLQKYELTALVGQETQKILAVRRADSVSVVIEAASGTFRRSFHEPGELFILDNLLFNHLALLGRRLANDRFAETTVRVVVPQVAAVLPAKITAKDPEADGSRIVEIELVGVTEVLEFDAKGELVAVEVPTQGIRAVRVGSTADRKEPTIQKQKESMREATPEEPASPSRRLFEEKTLRFPAGEIELDGILTLPRGGQKIPYPAVLFIHGSGPLDRDETVGANRPFRDLAHGLAVYGIASFRYDKRTLAAPHTVDPVRVTVREEVIEDAILALEALRDQGTIDRESLVILGHSLGGGLAAGIANRAPPVAGLVLLAASPRPLDQLLKEQIEYIYGQFQEEGVSAPMQEEGAKTILAEIDSLRAGTLPLDRRVLGMSGYYLKDYNSRDLGADLLAFKGPALVLQGGKDYQVTQTDFDLWQKIVAEGGKQNATFRFFPELGHLFMPIEGKPTPAKVMQAGSVDPGVIREIADFIQALP